MAFLRNAGAKLVGLPGGWKRLLKVAYDLFALAVSLSAAMVLTFGLAGFTISGLLGVLAFAAPSLVLTLASRALYAPIAYSRDTDLLRSALFGAVVSATAYAGAGIAGFASWSVGALVILMALLVVLIGGARVVLRAILSGRRQRERERVIIYGAGEAGRQLLAALQERRNFQVVAFVDDSASLAGARIGGVEVFQAGRIADVVRMVRADTVLLAMPSISVRRRREILRRLEPLEQSVRIIPDLEDITRGKALLSQVRAIPPEDLLGRDPVAPDEALVRSVVEGRSIMVTGAGGSIGSELCRQILRLNPQRLVVIEQSEYALYALLERLRSRFDEADAVVSAHLCTVEDETRMEQILSEHGVDAVFHAAAYKHVSLVETNAIDAVRNNSLGTLRVARAAIRAGVSTFVLVSTDKAVHPASVMGATKRLAELICRTLSHAQDSTRFALVRFGNVLDSSGSVAPLFRDQIERGGPVTVTHPEVTRYFMTISEAAQLVIQAAGMADGGDVFVLGMGKPVRIIDLATRMIRLAGHRPRLPEEGEPGPGEIAITFIGLRPGEKLREELFVGPEVKGTEHPMILREGDENLDLSELNGLIARLETACRTRDGALVRDVLAHRYVDLRTRSSAHDDDDQGAQIRR
ncbi:MAG: polysaccharide biosynthesis protein [Alphaproteobacteria bacterium]|nr:polysaccharide biosynthesis protein [Alphaproteobacteria bacterium]